MKTGKVVTKSKDDRYWEEHISTLIAKKIYGRQKENLKQVKSTVDNNQLMRNDKLKAFKQQLDEDILLDVASKKIHPVLASTGSGSSATGLEISVSAGLEHMLQQWG